MTWMSSHCEIVGNCNADDFVRSGTPVSFAADRERVKAALASSGSLLDGCFQEIPASAGQIPATVQSYGFASPE